MGLGAAAGQSVPHPQTARGGLPPAQRRFLTAIADNDDCWGRIANPQIWFRNAGLPTDRSQLRALLAMPA
jgi:hypothetical protein